MRATRSARFGSIRFALFLFLGFSLADGFSQSAQHSSTIQFSNVATSAGIRFVHFKGAKDAPMILAEQSPGVCVADYDGDGWQDIYFPNGGDVYGRKGETRNALYHNNGDGTFTDVTEKAGVPGTGYGMGCVWGDYDNDGFPDLFVSQYGTNVLYHNNRDGTFTDVTEKAGVGATEFGTKVHSGAVFFDYDRDGLLDLYVGGYVAYGPDSPQTCVVYGVKSTCPPATFGGSPPSLYHNNGDGTFTNVTKTAGLYQVHGKNLAVGAADYDNDGWPDLFVANDGVVSYLYHNQHNGTFEEVGMLSGMAFGPDGAVMAAMCISLGDYDNDGWLDLYISDWQGSSDHLWHNDHKGEFTEVTETAGIAAPTRAHLSFGGGFFDYDNDGWLDLFIANGHVFPYIEQALPSVRYRQTNSLFHNEKNGKFIETSSTAGEVFKELHLGRGVAFADFDNDGFVDVVVANDGETPLLLHNSGHNGNHFINFKLVGTKSNRDGIGARVRVVAGGISQIREVQSGGSYLSQSDLRANFGLGKESSVKTVEITWPSGLHQTFDGLKADTFYRITENQNEPAIQSFSAPTKKDK